MTLIEPQATIIYPESDGKPIADNTKQFEYIVTIKEGIDAAFRSNPDVFVAGDLLWYPVQGKPTIVTAPDVMVVFGRPKGHRRSYLQWMEGDIPPQIVFEILSHTNTAREMSHKLTFYQRYGVQEYYMYDPESGSLDGWRRNGNQQLDAIETMVGWVSPLLGIRFALDNGELVLYGPEPERRRFATYAELAAQVEAEQRARYEAEQRASSAEQRASEAQQEIERLRARLRSAGVQPE